MNLQELQTIQSLSATPSVSILCPTHRTAPDNAGDPIRLKNLLGEARARLQEQMGKREAAPVLERLDFLAEEIEWNYTLDGLALFASPDFAARYDLPFPTEERVEIGDNFATRDLVFSFNRSPRYRALVLSEQPTRLFEGFRDRLNEDRSGKFPIEHGRPGGALRLPGGDGVNSSAVRDEHDRHFFRAVERELGPLDKQDPLPLVVVGTVRNLAFWKEITGDRFDTLGTLEGSHDSTSEHDLSQLVWPVAQEGFEAKRREHLERLEAARGANQVASGLFDIWPLAKSGRVDTLVVEESFRQSARTDETGHYLQPSEDREASGFLEDAVDQTIEAVLAAGGTVRFYDPETLNQYDRIAAILRY